MVGPGALVWTEGERMGGSSSSPRESIWPGWPMRVWNRGLSCFHITVETSLPWQQTPLLYQRYQQCIDSSIWRRLLLQVLNISLEGGFPGLLNTFLKVVCRGLHWVWDKQGSCYQLSSLLGNQVKRMNNFILCLKMIILRQKDKEVTIRASPRQEIIMLKIK